MGYKEMTLEEFEKVVKGLPAWKHIEQWEQWFQMQGPAAQKMIDDAMKRKVKEYCDEV